MLRPARQIHRFRGLMWTLTVRELKARYRGSALGFVWSLVNPLLLLAVYSLVFGVFFRPRGPGGVDPYPLFLISGLFPWIWFATSIQEGTQSLVANAGLLRKAAFPAELLPMVAVLSNLFHFLLALPILAAALAIGRISGYAVGGAGVLLLPLVMALQFPLIAGLALALAALNALFKDVRDIVANLLLLGFFLTPIIYSLGTVPRGLQVLIQINPLTLYILAYQQALFCGAIPGTEEAARRLLGTTGAAPLGMGMEIWPLMAAVSLLGWWVGTWIFDRLRETLVEAA